MTHVHPVIPSVLTECVSVLGPLVVVGGRPQSYLQGVCGLEETIGNTPWAAQRELSLTSDATLTPTATTPSSQQPLLPPAYRGGG